MADLDKLRAALADVEKRARDLPWAKERPWKAKTHLVHEGELIVVDLHDLSVRLGVMVVQAVEAQAGGLQTGGVCIVTGAGRHTGGRSTLKDAVVAELQRIVNQRNWEVRPQGRARFLLIWDMKNAPAAASGQLGALFWGFVALLVFGIGTVLYNAVQ